MDNKYKRKMNARDFSIGNEFRYLRSEQQSFRRNLKQYEDNNLKPVKRKRNRKGEQDKMNYHNLIFSVNFSLTLQILVLSWRLNN